MYTILLKNFVKFHIMKKSKKKKKETKDCENT